MPYSFSIDPNEVLGVSQNSSLQEIRDAYREKAKRYHPDGGGDAWAFRIVSQAYQVLRTARVAGRAAQESAGAAPTHGEGTPAQTTERAWHGVSDTFDDPAQVVDIEMFLIRFAIEDPSEHFSRAPADRNLSCSLNVSWPSRQPNVPRPPANLANKTVHELDSVCIAVAKQTRAHASYSRPDEHQFTGWLSYPTAVRASEAFTTLKKELNARGLRVRQWISEMILARDRG